MPYQKLAIAIVFLYLSIAGLTSCQGKHDDKAVQVPATESTQKSIFNDELDVAYGQRIFKETQSQKGSTVPIIVDTISDKIVLFSFDYNRSPRFSRHLKGVEDEKEIHKILGEWYPGFYYDARYNHESGLAKFYFDTSIPDSVFNHFMALNTIKEYELIQFK